MAASVSFFCRDALASLFQLVVYLPHEPRCPDPEELREIQDRVGEGGDLEEEIDRKTLI